MGSNLLLKLYNNVLITYLFNKKHRLKDALAHHMATFCYSRKVLYDIAFYLPHNIISHIFPYFFRLLCLSSLLIASGGIEKIEDNAKKRIIRKVR